MTETTDRRIRDIVIVGGGTAGWMAAAALARFVRNGFTRIRVVESEEIGTVGVGEATIPPILSFLQMLRIDEDDFIARTQGSFKLGIEFADWTRPGHRYMHPFGLLGADIEGVPFHHFFLKHVAAGGDPDLETLSLTASAARALKFGRPPNRQQFPLNQYAYALHFDASLVAKYLRGHAEKLGVTRTEGKIVDVTLRGDDGFVQSLTLADGGRIDGDFFIDCSGFRGLVIEQALKAGFEDWSHWLPCDRALAVPTRNTGATEPYTRSTARPAGWQWHIPLQHRTGNGHVFSSAHMGVDEATAILMANLPGEALADPRLISFTSGRRKQFWVKNCLALGLAGGFLEPLESTAIHLVQTGVAKLIALFPDKDFNPVEIAEYNRIMGLTYAQVRDFIILHYKANERVGDPFWDACRAMDIPESLQRKIDLFRVRGRLFRFEDELFSVTSWVAVLLGQGIHPERIDEITNAMSDAELADIIARMRGNIDATVRNMPPQADFIARHCAARRA